MTEPEVREALRSVEDPEAGMNIVDLGLVYAIVAEPGRVRVEMTMLVRVSKVVEGDPKQGEDPLTRAAGLAGAAQFEAYLASLRKQAEISVNPSNLEKK